MVALWWLELGGLGGRLARGAVRLAHAQNARETKNRPEGRFSETRHPSPRRC